MVNNAVQTTPAATSIAAAVSQACERQATDQEYGALSKLLRTEFQSARQRALAATKQGDVVAKRLSAFTNSVVRALYTEGLKRFPEAADKVALCAVGGFGRDLLAPQSDIDLLFLHQFKDENQISPFLNFILYALFDAGLVVGQSVHTPQSALAFAKGDIIGRTNFLDARLIDGDAKTFKDFSSRFDRLRLTTKNQFVKAKLEEREQSHERTSKSRFLAEPDIKESKGGLRDIHLLRWLYRYVFDGEIDDPSPKKRILSAADIKAFQKAERFLWSVRVHLHDIRRRSNELLSFEVQPELANRLGYRTRSGSLPAERLMKHYFVNASEVGRLTRIFCAKLEEEQNKLRPRTPKLFPKMLTKDEASGKPNLRLKNGRLDFQSAAAAKKNPGDFFRLFRAFAKRPDLDFSPNALALISQNVASVTTEVRRDKTNNTLFLATLMQAKEPVKMLRVMAETGLLAKFLPYFGALAGRVQYGLYRRYAIDEHVFQAIGVLSEIKDGSESEEHPIASQIIKSYDDLVPFYLVVLLYEARFSLNEYTHEAMQKLVRRIASRFCENKEDIDDIAWTASRLGRMIELAKRRNLSDRQTISGFAGEVATRKRLDLYLVLSVCHLRVVGVNTWDAWTRSQLSDVYHSALAHIRGGDVGVEAWLAKRAQDVRSEAALKLSHWVKEERTAFLDRTPNAIVRSLDADQLARFANLARSARAEKMDAAVDAQLKDGFVEAMVYTDDRQGLLADLAGVVAGTGVSVRSVLLLTSSDDKAVDIFTIQSLDGEPIDDPGLVHRLHERLLAVAKAPPKEQVKLSKRLGDRRAIFSVPSEVRLDLEASDECVVVEAEGRDRPGLLYKLASALTDIGVTIKSAHIATYGERAVDSFYLQDAPGYKITNKRRLQSIERRLLNVLNAEN